MSLVTVQVQGADGVFREAIGDLIGGNFYPIYKTGFGVEGSNTLVSAADPLPVEVHNEAGIIAAANLLHVQAKLIDESGAAFGVERANNRQVVAAKPYAWEVAEGLVSGMLSLNKFGHNVSVGASVEDVWDGSAVYVYLTAAEQLQVSSSDVDDQGSVLSSGTATGGSTTTLVDGGATFSSDGVAAGDIVLDDTNVEHGYVLTVDSETQITISLAKATAFESGDSYRVVNANDTGAAVVEIQGLDANYDELMEYVVLATADKTATVGSFIRVFRAKVLLAGTTGWNEGNIRIRNNADSNLLAQIVATFNQTLMAMWTVPNGKTAYLTSFSAATSSSKATEVFLFVRPFGGVFQIKEIITIFEGDSSFPYDFPLKITQRSDVVIRASAVGGGGDVSAGFDLWYE